MITLTHSRLAAIAASAALGAGVLAPPTVALASSHATKSKVVKSGQSSSRDSSRHDASSPDRSSGRDNSPDR
jgi:hypothetical protein